MNTTIPLARPTPSWESDSEAVENSETSLTISRLATLLANGIRVHAGEPFPDGWHESAEGRRRRYSQAMPHQIRAARRLLHSDSSQDTVAAEK